MSESLCSICHSENFKYTCPSCNTRTCSLICVKRHKLQMQCTGQKDPTKYLKKDAISLVEVNRDYNFLLNVNRRITVGKEDAKQTKPLSLNVLKRPFNNSNSNNNGIANRPAKRVYTNSFEDTNVSVKRGVNVKFVPKGMSRSNINKTGYDKKKDCFNWTIEWLLIDGDMNKVLHRFTSYKCNEGATLISCFPSRNFIKFINAQKLIELEGNAIDLEEIKDDKDHKATTQDEDIPEFFFFLRNYKQPIGKKIHLLNADNLIADLLRNKTVLEFPTIYVSLTKDILGMKVIDDSIEQKPDSESESDSSGSSEADTSDESGSDDSSDDDDDEGAPDESSTKPIEPNKESAESTIESNFSTQEQVPHI